MKADQNDALRAALATKIAEVADRAWLAQFVGLEGLAVSPPADAGSPAQTPDSPPTASPIVTVDVTFRPRQGLVITASKSRQTSPRVPTSARAATAASRARAFARIAAAATANRRRIAVTAELLIELLLNEDVVSVRRPARLRPLEVGAGASAPSQQDSLHRSRHEPACGPKRSQ